MTDIICPLDAYPTSSSCRRLSPVQGPGAPTIRRAFLVLTVGDVPEMVATELLGAGANPRWDASVVN